jgi:hypothetical protein
MPVSAPKYSYVNDTYLQVCASGRVIGPLHGYLSDSMFHKPFRNPSSRTCINAQFPRVFVEAVSALSQETSQPRKD